MPALSQSRILRRVAERLDHHFAVEGFVRATAGRADELRWIKRPDDAPGDELDRVAIQIQDGRPELNGWAVRGWAWSWTRTAPVNLRVLAIEHREPGATAPGGWLCTSEAAIAQVLEELEGIVHGQLIGWLDEPVPLGDTDGPLTALSTESERLLSSLVIPSSD